MAEVSPTSKDLWLLDGPEDFQEYAIQLVQRTQRNLSILSRDLDALVYGNPSFVDLASNLTRSNRNAHIQLLIKDTKPAAERGHKIIRLAQRLPGKISIRKMTVEPHDKKMGFMLCDANGLLYKNDDDIYRGFANFSALREVKQLSEQFNYLWQYGEIEPEFQVLKM